MPNALVETSEGSACCLGAILLAHKLRKVGALA